MYDIDSLANTLRERQKDRDVEKVIRDTKCSRSAFVLAKTFLNPQAYGAVLEAWAKNFLGMTKVTDKLSGDLHSKGKNYEVKCSVSSKTGSFNYLQIRPHHQIDEYILINYSIELDEVIWIKIPSKKLYELFPDFGGYAHGTEVTHGKITMESIAENIEKQYEYVLRPNMEKPGTKPHKLWIELSKYIIDEEEIRKTI